MIYICSESLQTCFDSNHPNLQDNLDTCHLDKQKTDVVFWEFSNLRFDVFEGDVAY